MFLDKVSIIVIVLVSLLSCNVKSNDSDTYSRSDCIVRVDLTWPSDASFDKRIDVINEVRTPSKLKKVVAGYTIDSDGSPDSIYIQFFPSGCGKKRVMAEEFLRGVSRSIPDFPPYNVSNDRIYPSSKTIELNGPSWEK